MNTHYCNNLFNYSRFQSRIVTIGDIALGGDNPIRIQSMTTTDTMDTQATVEQSIRMIDAGCELVRITAPSMKEAQNLELIKKELRSRGYTEPLIADIHYTPNAAELAARIVEKVRVNPGNYADKKKFETIDYTDSSYNAELDRIRERFIPLVKICKEYGTAMRIGTNHGSLSDRILSRYGDTPIGMVESALEFLRICEDEGYHNIVLSMKASSPQVMVQAYRLLVNKMIETNRNYPLHLGVTEAGDGEDGRIKSAVGIGTLLEDGLGDTVRVSLTEDPEFEIPVAKALIDRYSKRKNTNNEQNKITLPATHNPFEYNKRITNEVVNIGGNSVPRVIADLSYKADKITAANLFAFGYNYSVPLDKWNLTDQACDYIFIGDKSIDFEIPGTLGIIQTQAKWKTNKTKTRCYPLFSIEEFISAPDKSNELNFVAVTAENCTDEKLSAIAQADKTLLVLETQVSNAMQTLRSFFLKLIKLNIKTPVIVKCSYQQLNDDDFRLHAATDIGGLLLDGFGNGTWIKAESAIAPKHINATAFGILQATRTRISKTEYISCPSCGRTLFDLQETTAKIRTVTDHLKGVKIGIMGCIVNGPGEMADADYGYVGTGVGKITLYKGKEVVQRNIASEKAVNALIELIKKHGDWVEKEVSS